MKISYPLHVAVEENSAEMVGALLRKRQRKTPWAHLLHLLQVEAMRQLATVLKARGFAKGMTVPEQKCMMIGYPHHMAVEENSAEMVAALLRTRQRKTPRARYYDDFFWGVDGLSNEEVVGASEGEDDEALGAVDELAQTGRDASLASGSGRQLSCWQAEAQVSVSWGGPWC